MLGRRDASRLLVLTLVGALLGVPSAAAPDTPAVADQVRERQYWLEEYRITQAWEITRGAGVRIAIIDTGIDASHQDLAGALVGGADFSGLGSPDGLTPVGPERRHGTMVASLAAGRGNNGVDGVLGSAPEAELLSLSMSFGGGTVSPDEQVANAVRFAVDNGADIISLSLTRNTRDWPESWDRAFGYAADNDVVVIAAAGNRGSGTVSVGAPATMPGVLTVGGVDQDGQASDSASSQGITIGVMAPSEGLVGATPGGGYVSWSGTSGATPIVAGIVALVRSAYPDLDAANVINRVLLSANRVTDTVPDPIYGYGLIDAYAALTADVPFVSANPLGSLDDWVVLHRKQEGNPIVVPLGPQSTVAEEEQALPPRIPARDDPQWRFLPYVVTVGFVSLLLVVVLTGGVLVLWRLRKR
ncbi:MAG: S8 family serine peptidase [Actinomycetota bacterium]|nr:S8 family serine peptidase [Actinomycetota bacterium]